MSLISTIIGYQVTQTLNDHGTLLYLLRRTRGAYNPSTGQPAVTETSYEIQGKIIKFSEMKEPKSGYLKGDGQGLFDPASFPDGITPELTDRISDGTTTYSILDVNPISSADNTLIYELHLRV